MNIPTVKFNTQQQPDFIKALRKNVSDYFKDNNISQHGDWRMIIKTIFMVLLYFVPFILMLTGVVSGVWPVMLMWLLMGLGMSGIGLSIMHDANHGSYSKNKNVNNMLGFLSNFVGAYHINWKIQHNVLHHSFTNVEGFDEDIEQKIMRFCPGQERKKIFRFQVFYAPILYGAMTMYWVFWKDFKQIRSYSKRNLLQRQGLTFSKALTQVISYKTVYLLVTLLLPILLVDIAWWQTVLGFFGMHFVSGLILALIFQTAHVIEETDFFIPDENGNVENNWAIHQLRTTANFARGSKILSWYVGGLNFQIEHHLFPNICHIHYSKISKIVKETALAYNVPYNEHKTFAGALRSHFSLLNALGNGSYDKRLQTVKVKS